MSTRIENYYTRFFLFSLAPVVASQKTNKNKLLWNWARKEERERAKGAAAKKVWRPFQHVSAILFPSSGLKVNTRKKQEERGQAELSGRRKRGRRREIIVFTLSAKNRGKKVEWA